MNKTISINIGGFVFNIEENAYQKLYHYLNSIKKNFTAEEERDEIMNDIESRIAEIFQSKLSISKEVIVERDVEEVIEIMGLPEDYVSDEFAQNAQSKEQSGNTFTSEKRLYRDTENAAIGGVASGLSHYLNIDVTIIRILFVVLAILGGSGILIYVILLFVVPEAKTTSDRMQMKGEPINIESIKEHFRKIKDQIEENAKNGKFRKTFNQTIRKGSQLGATLGKTFSKIIGVSFILGGAFALILLFVVLFGSSGFIPMVGAEHTESLSNLLNILYPGDTQGGLVFFAIILASLIPVLSIIFSGIKIVFNIKKSLKTVAITSSILWFLSIAVLVITGINLGMSMRSETAVTYDIPYTDSSDVLTVDVMEDDIFSEHIRYRDVWNQTELIRLQDEKIALGFPELYLVEKNDSGNFAIIVHKQSNGLSNQDAIVKAENISYGLNLTGNKLMIPPYYTVPQTDKFRGQHIQVEVQVPLGKRVELGTNIDRIDLETSPGNRYEEKSYANTTWTAKSHRMVCEACHERPWSHWER